MIKSSIEQKINQKIKNMAKEINVGDVNRIRTIVVLERLIARLTNNPFLSERLIFCGGFVLLRTIQTERFTIDADAIISKIPRKKLDKEVAKAINVDLKDGVWFGDLDIEEMTTENGYGSIRYKVSYKIGEAPKTNNEEKKLRKIHIDIVLGAEIGSLPISMTLESIIGIYEPIPWKIYPLVFIAAEKIHALVSREGASTRAKDIYDLSLILPQCKSKKELLNAIKFIFKYRGDKIPKSIFNTIKNYDTSLLTRVWQKIYFLSPANDFKNSWQKLLHELENLKI